MVLLPYQSLGAYGDCVPRRRNAVSAPVRIAGSSQQDSGRSILTDCIPGRHHLDSLGVFISTEEAVSTPRVDARDGISQAISQAGALLSSGDLDVSRVKLGVALRLLNAAGWDVFDVSQVLPDYRTGNARVDFTLMASPPGTSRSPAIPQVLIEVKSQGENLESSRTQRRIHRALRQGGRASGRADQRPPVAAAVPVFRKQFGRSPVLRRRTRGRPRCCRGQP